MIPFISTVTNVLSDGNCGFRAEAVSMERKAEEWIEVCKEMLAKMYLKGSVYGDQGVMGNIWGKSIASLKERLNHTQGPCGIKLWMHFPTHGYLLADTYRSPVVLFSRQGSTTYLPLCHPPTENPPLCVIFLEELRHLISFKFKRDLSCFPYPQIDCLWQYHSKKEAKPWKNKVQKNLNVFQGAFNCQGK